MEKVNSRKSSEVERRLKRRQSIVVLIFRWFSTASIFVCFFSESQSRTGNAAVYITLALALIYTILLSIHVHNCSGDSGLNSMKLACLDVILLSFILIQIPEAYLLIYLLKFFILAFYGILNSVRSSVKLAFLVLLFHSLAFILLLDGLWTVPDILRLITENGFLLFASYGVFALGKEMKKYGELHKKEFKLARTDKLTGLANRHYLDQKLPEEASYSDMNGSPLNILIFDLDNFKKFNDTYGHIWGDKLLMLFSDIIKQNVRKTDIPVRYGGEEFLILIRDLDIQLAKSVGERIRRQLEKQKIFISSSEGSRRMTVSCGIAQYPGDSHDIREAVELADQALYAAKDSGKNIVVCYSELKQVGKEQFLK